MISVAPRTLEQALSPPWLTAALAPRFPGIDVSSVTVGPVTSRLTTNARFEIDCAGPVPEGLSRHLCVKGYFTEAGWPYRQIGEAEVCFYRDLAGMTGLRTLRPVYADVDPTTHHGVMITEDVVVQGATFLDSDSDYSADLAADSLAELAKLHATTWCADLWAAEPWLNPRLEFYLAGRGADVICGNFDSPVGSELPNEVRDGDRLADVYRIVARQASTSSPWSVIHGDTHVANVFLDGDGRPSFVDWQLVQRGPWYLDVGYHIASALTIEDRRKHERDLLGHYLGHLAAAGIDAPSLDEGWRALTHGFVHGFYLWAITLKVDRHITRALVTRLGTAVADHDAFSAIAD